MHTSSTVGSPHPPANELCRGGLVDRARPFFSEARPHFTPAQERRLPPPARVHSLAPPSTTSLALFPPAPPSRARAPLPTSAQPPPRARAPLHTCVPPPPRAMADLGGSNPGHGGSGPSHGGSVVSSPGHGASEDLLPARLHGLRLVFGRSAQHRCSQSSLSPLSRG